MKLPKYLKYNPFYHMVLESKTIRFWSLADLFSFEANFSSESGNTGIGICFPTIEAIRRDKSFPLKGHIAFTNIFSFYWSICDSDRECSDYRSFELRHWDNCFTFEFFYQNYWDTDKDNGFKWYIPYLDIICGKYEVTQTLINTYDYTISLPEGNYDLKIQKFNKIVTRKRFISPEILDAWDIEVIHPSHGIPHWGKGENSWDCGMSAIHSLYTVKPLDSMTYHEIGDYFKEYCLTRREKYCHSRDWCPTLEEINLLTNPSNNSDNSEPETDKR